MLFRSLVEHRDPSGHDRAEKRHFVLVFEQLDREFERVVLEQACLEEHRTHGNSHRELNDLATTPRNEDELAEALKRAANLLTDIRDEYANAARPDTRKLEESLSGIDRMLDEGIRNSTPLSEMADLESEVDAQVKPYKRHMDKEVFAQTRENLLKKRLREHFGVPRLSLFFLHT